MLRPYFRGLAVVALFGLAASLASAQVSRAVPFQARLTRANGQLIDNPAQPITFSLYTVPIGGTAVYTETQNVPVFKGILATTIGSGDYVNYSELPTNVQYWVGVQVGSDPEMAPRFVLGAVPYAAFAQTVGEQSISHSQLISDPASLSRVSGGMINYFDGKIGIGTLNPGALLDVNGGVKIEGGNTLEFGAGVAGKEGNAGKIGYGTFTIDTLDIVGAGNQASQRRIKFHAEGGAAFSGGVTMAGWVGAGTPSPQGALHVKGNQNVLLLEGADHAYIEFYPRGFSTGRKAYIGFPGAYSHDLNIANEDGGAVRVVGTFINNSDARYKTNVAPLDDALGSVLKLRGVSYDWRKDLPGQRFPDQRQIGFIAQDVEKVLPDLVYTDTQGEKSVAYVNVIPVLVEAIKQQQAEISALKAEVQRLKH